MSKALRLPSIINRFIVEKWLDDNSASTSQDENFPSSSLVSISTPVPFYAHFSGSSISDSHYFLSASSAVPLPANSEILITDWNLFYSQGLHLVILQAELQTEDVKQAETLKIRLEKNPLIFATIKKFIFQKLQKKVKNSAIQDEKPFFFQSKPRKITKNPSKNIKKIEKPEKITDNYTIKEESDDDIFDMIDLTTIDPSSKLKPNQTDWNIGIDQFPEYALEYLKHKYNLI